MCWMAGQVRGNNQRQQDDLQHLSIARQLFTYSNGITYVNGGSEQTVAGTPRCVMRNFCSIHKPKLPPKVPPQSYFSKHNNEHPQPTPPLGPRSPQRRRTDVHQGYGRECSIYSHSAKD